MSKKEKEVKPPKVRIYKESCRYCEHLRTVMQVIALILQVVILAHLFGVF